MNTMVTNGDTNPSKKPKLTRVTAAKKAAAPERSPTTAPPFLKHIHYRGLYSRVARRLGIDRSYVSRVASGERESEKVKAALLKEIQRIEKLKR